METFFLFLGIIIAIGIIVGVVNMVNNSKHKKESQVAFENLKDFKADNHYLSTSSGMSIGFDNQRKKICFLDKMHEAFIYDYNKILQCEVAIDGQTVLKQSTTGTIGRSVLGGILGGGIGALIGGATGAKTQNENISSIDLKIIINDTINPVFKINFLNLKTKKGSMIYKIAYSNIEKWHGIVSGLIMQGNHEESNNKPSENLSVADELKKLKDLLDNGVLTPEEFVKQKSKLIN